MTRKQTPNPPLKPLGLCSLKEYGFVWDLHTTLLEWSYFKLKLLRLMLGQKH